jgi:hypothetical protein
MDILDAAVDSIAHDDYNHIPEDVFRQRLANLRGTRIETALHEAADTFIEEVRRALTQPSDPTYGP